MLRQGVKMPYGFKSLPDAMNFATMHDAEMEVIGSYSSTVAFGLMGFSTVAGDHLSEKETVWSAYWRNKNYGNPGGGVPLLVRTALPARTNATDYKYLLLEKYYEDMSHQTRDKSGSNPGKQTR